MKWIVSETFLTVTVPDLGSTFGLMKRSWEVSLTVACPGPSGAVARW